MDRRVDIGGRGRVGGYLARLGLRYLGVRLELGFWCGEVISVVWIIWV